MKSDKMITSLLIISCILLFGLFSLFFFFIYSDTTSKRVETLAKVEDSELEETVIPVVLLEEDDRTPQNQDQSFKVEPTIREEKFEEEELGKINKFYYNQLDSYSKLIYKTLEDKKEDLKTGTAIIELPEKIMDVIKTGNGTAIFSIAVNAFEYDNPDVFYLDISKLILSYYDDGNGNYKIYLKPNEQYSNYLEDSFNNKKEVEDAEEQIKEVVQEIINNIEDLSKEEKIKYVHDWLVSNIKYDETLSKTNRSDIYGAFIVRDITCGGYAKAFKYIVDQLRIECIIVQGEASSNGRTENHAWNYIKLNNKWYGVDCTWDDPIIIGGDESERNKIYYTYYLKGQNVFNTTHRPFETFYSTNVETPYPKLEKDDF